ncbi:hypothetical protein RND71_040246 [Anisodus tanguticus]|uniref:DUF4283 domain-containing protein n=1 Tax=Anisodus tanguticus TaxID=243964 RepID=A0AAE1UVJ7_9SOLA|nr:hypothetical protein RND71_040246 [Anisodus tanguticus]
MAIPASGRPPPEVGLHPTIPTQPLNYSNLFKSAPNIPSIQFSETVNGGTPTPRGTPSPMAISIPLKPIVYLHGEPTIRFEKKEVEVMIHHQDLTMAVVGKFSHGWPDIAFLSCHPKAMWLEGGGEDEALFDANLQMGCYIQSFGGKSICVWVDLVPGLSPHYYGESTLFSLAAAVVGEGDGITSELQKIRYDFKPKYCTNCKLQGHDVDGCWTLKPELRPEKAKEIDGGKAAMAVTTSKGKASNPNPSSSNPSQQTPPSTTNALIPHPSNKWITITGKNKKNKNQNQKPPTKPSERNECFSAAER